MEENSNQDYRRRRHHHQRSRAYWLNNTLMKQYLSLLMDNIHIYTLYFLVVEIIWNAEYENS